MLIVGQMGHIGNVRKLDHLKMPIGGTILIEKFELFRTPISVEMVHLFLKVGSTGVLKYQVVGLAGLRSRLLNLF